MSCNIALVLSQYAFIRARKRAGGEERGVTDKSRERAT